ncbi:hypothetical protein T440DRAFT_503636 [Plenodomus tracheiphilus IPT5]|uniref:Uncharacterized protein n=1 Tax=Plenodomus tracheiphilus IPT5 TaxID=1408161 RepID=A0A6A7BK81_9PLEO|nr:hypothetical protein T440DRAFT_503636 [Plenodomus tracheiphilus IPT5]
MKYNDKMDFTMLLTIFFAFANAAVQSSLDAETALDLDALIATAFSMLDLEGECAMEICKHFHPSPHCLDPSNVDVYRPQCADVLAQSGLKGVVSGNNNKNNNDGAGAPQQVKNNDNQIEKDMKRLMQEMKEKYAPQGGVNMQGVVRVFEKVESALEKEKKKKEEGYMADNEGEMEEDSDDEREEESIKVLDENLDKLDEYLETILRGQIFKHDLETMNNLAKEMEKKAEEREQKQKQKELQDLIQASTKKYEMYQMEKHLAPYIRGRLFKQQIITADTPQDKKRKSLPTAPPPSTNSPLKSYKDNLMRTLLFKHDPASNLLDSKVETQDHTNNNDNDNDINKKSSKLNTILQRTTASIMDHASSSSVSSTPSTPQQSTLSDIAAGIRGLVRALDPRRYTRSARRARAEKEEQEREVLWRMVVEAHLVEGDLMRVFRHGAVSGRDVVRE